MRPVTLTVAGMRSYRAQRTLDFTDRTLMAILGDTGSGKSSLLEALYGALYGGSTWDDRGGLKAMIADGVQTLQIELVFHARGQTYKVARSTSRKNYPPSNHVFDGPNGEHLDGEKAVNARIVQLIGLTGQEFLRVVILPQGRFGQLLQGTAGERTPILRGILGLGVLDRVRNAADNQLTELHAALAPIVAARARLYPNPRAIANAAAADSERHMQTVQRLRTAATAVSDLDDAVRTVNATLPSLTTALNTVRAVDLTPARQALPTAQTAAAQVAEQELALTQRTAELQARNLELKAQLDADAAAGNTPAGLATMNASLSHLDTVLPALAARAVGHAEEQDQLTAATAALAVTANEARAAAELADARAAGLTALSAAASFTAATAGQQAEHVAAVDAAREGLAPQRDRLSTSATDTVTAALALHAATAELAVAASTHADACAALGALRAANAAAHVARQHRPGEACPVCAQTLPVTFIVPAIVGEDALMQSVEAAEHALTQATATHRQAERAHDAQQQTLLTVADTAATAAGKLTDLLSPWHATAGLDRAACASAAQAAAAAISQLPATAKGSAEAANEAAATLTTELCAATGVDLADTLASSPTATPTVDDVERERLAAATAYETAHAELGKLTTAAHRLQAKTEAATEALDRRRLEHHNAATRTTQASQDLAVSIAALPDLLSVPLVAALGLSCADPGAALLTAGAVPPAVMTELRTHIESRQAELDRLSAARDELNTEHRNLDGHRVMLRDRTTETVDRPRAAARRSYERASSCFSVLTGTLADVGAGQVALAAAGAPTPIPPLPAGLAVTADLEVSDARLLAEVDALSSRLSMAIQHADGVLDAARQGVIALQEKATALLAAAGTRSLDELSERLVQAKVELKLSDVQRDRATAQVPIATGLDVGLDALNSQLGVLRQIKDLLSPSSFPQYVVEQRQVALLRIASSLFGKLTRDGYGFVGDFMIVDRRTGQPRPPKTLSGGETFLASLALALALVEVSNRSGGQLDCLFLDEGFGSLDASILAEALDVLRLQATDGRLVGIISHLHAVAAELDDVLVVTKEIEGSTFRWLNADERDAYLLDEAAAGLLS